MGCHDDVLHSTTVDGNGRFAIDLPPGEYRVAGHSPPIWQRHVHARSEPTPTVVHANTVTHLELYCSIG